MFRFARPFIVLSAAISAVLGSMAANAVPVIPGATGFGIDTKAGRGGTVYRVKNLNADGSGSLKACVDASGPRVCVFEVSGTIKMPGDLIVRNRYITIAGQTAPSPGILLRGGGLLIKTSDVLVQHIRVRPGDDTVGTPAENRDALKIEALPESPISNVVIDHCSFAWSVDEMASAWQGWNNVSLLNNVFAEPLNDSIHPKGPHGFGMLTGPVNGSISIVGNLFAHMVERNPLSNATHSVFVNNVVYNWANMATDLQSRGAATNNAVVGNVYIRGLDYSRKNPPVGLRADSTGLPIGSKVYLKDNLAPETTSDPWSVAGTLGGTLNMLLYKVSSAPTWPSGLTPRTTTNNGVLNYVLSQTGARPADRDAVDKRVVASVQNRTGRIINCVAANGTTRCQKNGGGWPNLAKNTRALTLPANPNTVTSSGYTNLEIWLHSMSASVQGSVAAGAPGAPTALAAN